LTISDFAQPGHMHTDGNAISRRSFIKATAAAASAALIGQPMTSRAASRTPSAGRPNILLIMLDQQRAQPDGYVTRDISDAVMPSLKRLRQGAVSFDNFYCAATNCCPSRGTLITGLYAHQTGYLTTNGMCPRLDTGFKTWGHSLRDEGYATNWFGRWHISREDDVEPYGFGGGTDLSKMRGKPQGIDKDPIYMESYLDWFDSNAGKGPWATAISLTNPHDICEYWKKEIQDFVKQNPARAALSSLPANLETDEQLAGKPSIQQIWRRIILHQYMSLRPFETVAPGWPDLINAYLALQQTIDIQITRVLDALDKRPDVRDNTIIVFLADHGEYLGAHGLCGKGYALYDEAIKIPLIVKDPTGRWAKQPEVVRQQLASMVDIHGLMLTLATGGNDWRAKPQFSHLRNRLDIGAILQNPRAAGRDYVLHTCDELPPLPHLPKAGVAPNHIVGMRTASAKLGIYSDWQPDTANVIPEGQQFELYDYNTQGGRAELDNAASSKPALLDEMRDRLVNDIIPRELHAPLPPDFAAANERAMAIFHENFDKREAQSKK